MKKICILLSLIISVISFAGCSSPQSKDVSSLDKGSDKSSTPNEVGSDVPEEVELLIQETIKSEALKNNIVDENTERPVYILLPPSYYESDKTYPVVYYFNGYNESVNQFTNFFKNKIVETFKGGAKEFILVCVDGRSNCGGSFFENSPIAGNWEDYVFTDVIPYIDENYRTIKDSKSRGFAGYSMGGFAAYNLALKHPDVTSAFLAIAPGIVPDGDIKSAFDSWTGTARTKTAYARAYSPNKDIPDVFGNIPTFDNTPEDNKIVADWENGYGSVTKKVDAYVALNTPLTNIKIIYGESDTYNWIPKGCEYLAERLKERNIEHTIQSYPGNHSLPVNLIETYFIPFFNENLTY